MPPGTAPAHEFLEVTGLTEAEAAGRLRADGPNELPSAKKRGAPRIALEVAREPMFLLLIAVGSIYLALGDNTEALMLLGFVFVIIGITFYQERKTERALEALRDLSSPRALVIREGLQRRIPGREAVRGDIVVLSEGDRVPADGAVTAGRNLLVDESLLTGESVPVRKNPGRDVTAMARPGGEDQPFVYSGTLVVQGQGLARILATGLDTEMGKIGRTLQSITTGKTPLQGETAAVVRRMGGLGLLLCLIVIVVYGLTRQDWLHGFLAGLTLAMAMVPEEFPVVLTVFLALGAWRISRKNVLTRKVPAVETLGSATILCVDKTGTLTQNRMTVRKLCAGGVVHEVDPGSPCRNLPDDLHELGEFSILASQIDPFDPMEKALKELGETALAGTEHLHRDWTLVQEYPLSRRLLAMSRVWKSPDGRDYVIAAKGAPEAIADLCHMDAKETRRLETQVASLADEGLRVLGVAKSHFSLTDLPGEQHDFRFGFVGLLGLEDPVRPGVARAIAECYGAGIRVAMITGDYPGTALHIARRIGLETAGGFITGPELETMEEGNLRLRLRTVNVFARMVPEQKLRLVDAFKANGHIVAMTGDGVNDATALKSAQIGIAMGARGTDVAREAADLVLLDDDFSSIVQAVRTGRRTFDNLRKAVAYILGVHVPIAGVSLVPVVLGWPLILLPMHIVFLELIIDPSCSIVFEVEPEEKDIMKRPPRRADQRLFDRRTIGLALLQGLSVLFIVLAVYGVSLGRGQAENHARALSFATLIVANLGLIMANRSRTRTILEILRSPNGALWWVTGGAFLFLGMVLCVPFLRELFRFSPLHLADYPLALAAGLLSLAWFEILKVVRRIHQPAARRPG